MAPQCCPSHGSSASVSWGAMATSYNRFRTMNSYISAHDMKAHGSKGTLAGAVPFWELPAAIRSCVACQCREQKVLTAA